MITMYIFNNCNFIFFSSLIIITIKSVKCDLNYCDSVTGINCECEYEPCFRKCCNLDEIYLNKTCVKPSDDYYYYNEDNRNVKSHQKNTLQLIKNDINDEKDYYLSEMKDIIYGVPCNGTNIAFQIESDDYKLFTNGSLLRTYPSLEVLDTKNYCTDIMNENEENYSVIFCFQPYVVISPKHYIESICLFISLPFFLITGCVFFFNGNTSKNLPGKILIAYIFTVIVSNLLLFDLKMNGISRYFRFCLIIGYAAHVTLLANFFWLNAMCYDIWQVFSGRSLRARSMTKYQEWRKFMKYCLYAWGCPVIICTATFIADLVLPDGNRYKPMVGVKYCIINDNKSKMLFYFFPLILLLLLNVIMFSSTALKLFKHKKQTNVLRTGENQINNSAEKERLNLYFKLFLVMGITWVTEPISWIFNEKPSILWIICDCINLLQGIPIFIIFVCKKRYLEAVKSKLFSSYRRESTATSPYSTATTSTSQPSTRNDSKAGLNSTRNASQELEMIPDDKSISNISEEN
ncbi:G-protein coupled receptor Mth2-like isoform X2 [Lycorma delicatula]|uniref:G-protein coupled receptor Mth2-like isoform X2 n=1 Tax=Lycorma delicatula TaxID=130591 RepID=UPI003F51A887